MVFDRIKAGADGCLVEKNFSFAEHTTIGVGGSAAFCVMPKNTDAAVGAVRLLKREGVPYLLLGAGSNVLASDKGFSGAVVSTALMNGLCFSGEKIYAECGVKLQSLLRRMADEGVGGLSFMAGIPASIGGAVYMNAGTAEGHIGECVTSVTVLTEDGSIRELSADACDFQYKDTLFMRENMFILRVGLAGVFQCRVRILTDIADVLTARRRLPAGKSMGCVFKNPKGRSAGALIEECGLKGTRLGGAVVSDKHANFVINDKNACADDVRALIRLIKDTVFAETGILLQEEIEYIGDD